MSILAEVIRWAPMVTWLLVWVFWATIIKRNPDWFARRFFKKTIDKIEDETKAKLKKQIVFAICCGPMRELEERLTAVLGGDRISLKRMYESDGLEIEPPPVSKEEIKLARAFATELRRL